MTNPMIQQIDLAAGAVEYTWPLTIIEKSGKDISLTVIKLAIGTYVDPGEWFAPDRDDAQPDTSQRVVQLLVGGTVRPPNGMHYLWSQAQDSPEVVVRRHHGILITNAPTGDDE